MPDMIAARQELDLRPQLERLDRLICWSEDIDEGALTFAFRPLWQLDEPAKAALALSRAQATQVYAGLKLWPDAVMAKLAEAQLVADGTYPNAAAVFADGAAKSGQTTADAFPVRPGFDPAQPRAPDGRWTAEGGSASTGSLVPVAQHINEDPDPTPEEAEEELEEKAKAREDPMKFFRLGPDPNGILRIPLMPGGGRAPSIKAPPGGGASEAPASPVGSELRSPVVSVPAPKVNASPTGTGPSSISANATPPPIEGEAELTTLAPFWKPAAPKTPEEKAAHPLMRAFRAALDGDIETLEACKAELPPEIAKHLIPGFIGPGPFAVESIPIEPGQRTTRTMKNSLLSDGSPPRCHICGSTTMGETGGRLSLDHQLPTALNTLGWPQALYRHCRQHYSFQGGRVQFLQKYMMQEGLFP